MMALNSVQGPAAEAAAGAVERHCNRPRIIAGDCYGGLMAQPIAITGLGPNHSAPPPRAAQRKAAGLQAAIAAG